mgnify:CR=1 FL=1
MAPRKVRLVANLIKGHSANEAEAQLLLNPRKASEPILKLLRSAISNAKNQGLELKNIFIKEIRVDQGPMMKRFMPRAQGRATMIQKKSSHITLILAESEKLKAPRFKIVKQEKISKYKAEKIKKEKEGSEKEIAKKPSSEFKEGFVKKMFRRKSI